MHSANGTTVPLRLADAPLVYFDPGNEELFSLKQCEHVLGLTYKTMKRYACWGVPDINGKPVRLEVCRLPSGATATSREAYRRFIRRINAVENLDAQT